MRKLTVEEITKFASRRYVKRIAVENFLMSMPTEIGREGNVINVISDARDYKWDTKTIRAILDGIRLACDKEIENEMSVQR